MVCARCATSLHHQAKAKVVAGGDQRVIAKHLPLVFNSGRWVEIITIGDKYDQENRMGSCRNIFDGGSRLG
jgi:hypothetical protein